MGNPVALIGIKTEDRKNNELVVEALLNHESLNDGYIFSGIDIDKQRSFQDIEWLMFALMAIPATESIVNIVLAIKNEITKRVKKKTDAGDDSNKSIKMKIKIKISGNSDNEIEEEITIEVR